MIKISDYKIFYENVSHDLDNMRRNDDLRNINQSLGKLLDYWGRLDDMIHDGIHISEVKNFHDRIITVCPNCEDDGYGGVAWNHIKDLPSEKDINYYISASWVIINEMNRYYQSITSERHTFASSDNPCTLCKGINKSCLTIPHAITNKKLTMCVDFLKNNRWLEF